MDKDIIDILQKLQREREERMRKNIIERESTSYAGDKELVVNPYNRVMRENIAARAVYKVVDHVHKIYHNLTQEEIDKLFNDLFYIVMDFLNKHED